MDGCARESLSKSLQIAFIFSDEKEKLLTESTDKRECCKFKERKDLNALHRDSQPWHYRHLGQDNS